MEPTPKSSFEKVHNLDQDQVDQVDETQNYRKKRLAMAIALCLFLFLVQLIGGLISNSLALLADAFHMLSDVLGYCLSLAALSLASSPPSLELPFGKRRLEVLGALASVLLIWILSLGLVMEAFERLSNPRPINGMTMLGMAIGGVVINALLIMIFGHEHDDHDHTYTDIESSLSEELMGLKDEEIIDLNTDKKEFQSVPLKNVGEEFTVERSTHTSKDLNIRAAMLHAIGDLLCSIGVFISALVIVFNPSYLWIDPLCTFIFATVALSTTVPILSDIIHLLMQGTPSTFSTDGASKQMMAIPGVVSVDVIKCWQITQKELVATVRIGVSVGRAVEVQGIVDRVRSVMEKRGVGECTIETLVCASPE